MCLEYYPECGDGGDGCCEGRLKIALAYARRDTRRGGSTVPRIYCRLVDFQLYACWAVKGGTRISEFLNACCPRCAKAEFIAGHFFDKALDELNRMYSLEDTRDGDSRWWASSGGYKGTPEKMRERKSTGIGTHFLDKAEADAHKDIDRQRREIGELKRMMILSDRAMWAEWYSQRDVIRRAGLGTIPLPDGWVKIGDGD